MKEYKDVFNGIGILPGGPYHTELKENYKAVQHAPHQVAVSVKSAYKAELQRLLDAGIITEVHGHRLDKFHSSSKEMRWKFKTMP